MMPMGPQEMRIDPRMIEKQIRSLQNQIGLRERLQLAMEHETSSRVELVDFVVRGILCCEGSPVDPAPVNERLVAWRDSAIREAATKSALIHMELEGLREQLAQGIEIQKRMGSPIISPV